MAYEIRPLTIPEIFDRAFRVIAEHFLLFVGITAVVYVPYVVILGTGESQGSGAVMSLAWLGILIATPLMHAALTLAVTETCLDRTLTIGDAYTKGMGFWVRMAGTYVILAPILFLAFVLLVVPGIYLSVIWMLVGPIMVIEGRFGLSAVTRSRDLTRGHWWRTAAVGFIVMLMAVFLAGILNFFWSTIPLLGPLLEGVTSALISDFWFFLIFVI
jgi:hypothetical protein